MSDSEQHPQGPAAELRDNMEALKAYMQSFDEHVREEAFWGRRQGIEDRVTDLFKLVSRVTASLYGAMETTAIAIEAQRAETPSGSVHESAG